MEPLLWLVGLVLTALSIRAWQRSTSARVDIQDLEKRLDNALERLHALESAGATRRAAQQAAPVQPAPPPAVAQPDAAVMTSPTPPAQGDAEALPDRWRVPGILTPEGATALESPVTVLETPLPIATPDAPTPGLLDPVRWLLQGNPLAKLGVVLLFFGLAYLLRFSIEQGLLPIELRLTGAAMLSIALLVVGWRLRIRLPVYALTLQGGSIGALYLTSFAAFRVYSLLPSGLVFALLIVICAASVTLAVIQRAQSLAIMASLGGYLAPILLSTGGGNHVALFSYYAVLSIGILTVSVWQAWRPLNLIGFFFTFGVGALWGVDRYEPAFYASCQFFLLLNLGIYGVLALLTALRHGDRKTDALVDGTLAFGAPLIGFGLQVGLTNHWKYGPAFSALGYAAIYLPLAWLTLRRWPERGRRLTVSFLALGGGFVTLAIPLAWSARWTSLAWALEGLGVLWAGRTQRHARMTWSGTGLLLLAGVSAWLAWTDGIDTPTFLLVAAILSLTWMGGAWLWHGGEETQTSKGLSAILLAGGIFAWLALIVDGSRRLTDLPGTLPMLVLGTMSGTALAWRAVGTRLEWPALAESAFLLWPMATLVLVLQLLAEGHPFGSGAWSVAWIAAFGTAWQLLRSTRSRPDRRRYSALHATLSWIAFAVVGTEVAWRLDRLDSGSDVWKYSGWLVVSAAWVWIVWRLERRGHWSITLFPRAYWILGLLPALIAGGSLLVTANLLDGRMPGQPYIPLINPIEQAAAFTLLMAIVWQRAMTRLTSAHEGSVRVVILALLVWWGNGVLVRTTATIAQVPWRPDALWQSAAIQTTMALVWTVAALVCMTLAARRALRPVWFVGAAALAVVVVKLFVVDSARGGGLARAIAFIGVALLVLLIGYVAPLPPRAERDGGMPP